MINDVFDYWGKHVQVTSTDGQVFSGFVQSTESIADSDDGVASLDIIHSSQFPHDILNLRTDEIKNIKIVD